MNQSSKFYRIQKIIQKKLTPTGPLYLVKWKNYRKSQSTWEPLQNLKQAMGVVEQYEKESNFDLVGKKQKKIRKKSKDLGKEGKQKQLSIVMFMKKKLVALDSQNTSKQRNIEEEHEYEGHQNEKVIFPNLESGLNIQSNCNSVENEDILENRAYEKPERLEKQQIQPLEEEHCGESFRDEGMLMIKDIQERRKAYDFTDYNVAFDGVNFSIDRMDKERGYRISARDVTNLNASWLKNFYQSFF